MSADLLRSVPGMNDALPADCAQWHVLENAFRAMAGRYGFGEVRTPICEYTELFSRGIGEETDVVAKEMYSFEDRGGRSLTLRPEGTASAVRAYLEHKTASKEPVSRWYYAGPMFRGERPAKGRYRQFHQVGAEVYGDPSAAADAELIDFAHAFVTSLGITQLKVRINSLGSGDTKMRYAEALRAYYTPLKEKLSADSQRRIDTNPLRILDSKSPEDVALRAGAPQLISLLGDEDKKHFDKVATILTKMNTPFEIDPTIIRGLDYYTRTIFEITDTSGNLGAQDALGGGGRYDGLIQQLGGGAIPAVGFALGCERLLLAASPEVIKPKKPLVCAVIGLDRDDADRVQSHALLLAKELRAASVNVVIDTRFGKIDRQFAHAERCGAQCAIIFGVEELNKQSLKLKNLIKREEQVITLPELVGAVQRTLAEYK